MENKGEKGIFSRIYDWFVNLTLTGLLKALLVAFVIIIILFFLTFLPSIMGRISSSLSAALYSVFVPAEDATLTVDKKIVNSGEDFNITFRKGDMTDGLFTVSYPCNLNVDLMSVEVNGLKRITCDTPYYLLNNDSSIKIRAITQDSVLRLVLTGAFENNATQKSETVGVARVTVTNNSSGIIVNPVTPVATSTPNKPIVTPYIPSQPAPIQPIYLGKPDLAVRIIQVGLMSQGTNIITNQSQFNSYDMVGVKFEVRNDGDANTGIWYFTASLPSTTNPTYTSTSQISLKPGDSIIFTLGFSNLTSLYSNIITVSVDPTNMVAESNESNNILTQTITNLGYNNNYNNNTNGCYVNGVYTYNCQNNNNYNNGCYINGVYNPTCNNNYTNGCYVNGVFTYNCLNNNNNNNNTNGYYDRYGNWINYNNNYNNNNYNNYGTLGVTCSGTTAGRSVYWTASAFGGNNNYNNYIYSWSGDEGLSGSGPSLNKYYNYSGTKTATVTVQANGFYISHTCMLYVY